MSDDNDELPEDALTFEQAISGPPNSIGIMEALRYAWARSDIQDKSERETQFYENLSRGRRVAAIGRPGSCQATWQAIAPRKWLDLRQIAPRKATFGSGSEQWFNVIFHDFRRVLGWEVREDVSRRSHSEVGISVLEATLLYIDFLVVPDLCWYRHEAENIWQGGELNLLNHQDFWPPAGPWDCPEIREERLARLEISARRKFAANLPRGDLTLQGRVNWASGLTMITPGQTASIEIDFERSETCIGQDRITGLRVLSKEFRPTHSESSETSKVTTKAFARDAIGQVSEELKRRASDATDPHEKKSAKTKIIDEICREAKAAGHTFNRKTIRRNLSLTGYT